MSAHSFSFTLNLSDERHFDSMLAELAGVVCNHVGLQPDATSDLTAALRQALSAGTATGQAQCDVRFHAHAGELHVVVAFGGASEWRTSRVLPDQA